MSQRRIALLVMIAVILVVLGVGVAVRSCTTGRETVEQAKVDLRGADAYADAAGNAMATVSQAQSRDANVDATVTQASKDIHNAPNPEAARAAVVRSVCKLRAYSNRPECAVQSANSR